VVDGAMVFQGGNVEVEVDLGVGAGGAETVVTTFRGHGAGAGSGMCIFPLAFPLDAIGNGVRVAVRGRCSAIGNTPVISLSYREKPL